MKPVFSLVAVALMSALDAAAQLRLPDAGFAQGDARGAAPAETGVEGVRPPAPEPPPADPAPERLRLRNAALIGGGALAVGAYGMSNWWNEGFTGRFRGRNEGWFGQNTESGGADKFGHVWFTYATGRALVQGFEALGNGRRQAAELGLWTSLGIMTVVEVVDGYSRQFRFSAQDAIMNIAGAGLGYLMERNPELDRLIDFRLLYRASEEEDFDPAGDYSGQTYLLVAKASGVPALNRHPALRYFELAVGYGTRGYSGLPGTERERNVYFGISLNLSEVLGQTAFRGATGRGRAQRAADYFLEFIQVPGTAALARHQL